MGGRCCCFPVHRTASDSGVGLPQAPKNVRLFSYDELQSATQNFDRRNKIGGGGFGEVYKGTLRDGTEVAIKTLSAASNQGPNEFLTEIDTLSNIRHPNIVQLIGCCVENSNRILVYEYLENNCLQNALFGPTNERIALDWPKRAAICVGTARGLAFLHEEAEPQIVHRDIKASNVLLDKDLAPKIGDFGLAKLFPDNVTHISTRVAGTWGYVAPEYASKQQLTKKADIYSFGVLVLEIIHGSKPIREPDDIHPLVERTWKLRDEERLLDIVDPELVGYPGEDVLPFIKVALLCTQATPNQRPSMKRVVEVLSNAINVDVRSLIQPCVVKDTGQTSGNASGNSRGISRQRDGLLAKAASPITSPSNRNSTAMSTIDVHVYVTLHRGRIDVASDRSCWLYLFIIFCVVLFFYAHFIHYYN